MGKIKLLTQVSTIEIIRKRTSFEVLFFIFEDFDSKEHNKKMLFFLQLNSYQV